MPIKPNLTPVSQCNNMKGSPQCNWHPTEITTSLPPIRKWLSRDTESVNQEKPDETHNIQRPNKDKAPGTNNVLYYGRCGGSAATYRPRPRFGAPNAITPATIKAPSPAVTIPPHQRPARVTPRRHHHLSCLSFFLRDRFGSDTATRRR